MVWFPPIIRTLSHQLLPMFPGMNYETEETYQEFGLEHLHLANLAFLLPLMNGTINKLHFDNVNRLIPSVICSKPIPNIIFRNTLMMGKGNFP